MGELTLAQKYRLLSGNTQIDIDALIEKMKEADDNEKTSILGTILWTIPGGVGNTKNVQEFKKELYAAIDGVAADADKDGDVDQDDYNKVKSEKIDVNGDSEFTNSDLDLVKVLSTAQIEEIDDTGSDDDIVETYSKTSKVK